MCNSKCHTHTKPQFRTPYVHPLTLYTSSRQISSIFPRPTFNPRPDHVRYVADKVALVQVSLQVLQLPLSSFHRRSTLASILILILSEGRAGNAWEPSEQYNFVRPPASPNPTSSALQQFVRTSQVRLTGLYISASCHQHHTSGHFSSVGAGASSCNVCEH